MLLEEAVANEDYEKAAELDDLFQELKSEIEVLGLTDEGIELATEEDDDEFVTIEKASKCE